MGQARAVGAQRDSCSRRCGRCHSGTSDTGRGWQDRAREERVGKGREIVSKRGRGEERDREM